MVTQKRECIIPFHGGQISIRNAFDYPERDQAGNPTGATLKARAGVFITLPGQSKLDVSGLPLEYILSDTIVGQIKKNKLWQSIAKENDTAALAGADI